jgi:peptidoglycan/xylan/chitin deacetylase (PgdA/CDA1 family)
MRAILSTAAKRRIQAALVTLPPIHVRNGPRVVVLSYHSIHSSSGMGGTRPDAFDSHMRWLRQTCDVVPLSEILDHARCQEDRRPIVSVTFDDGFADNYTQAMPILLQHDIPATFFLATGLIDRDPSVLALAAGWGGWPQHGSILTWDEIRRMRRAGMVFGAHGHRHVSLGPMSDAEARADLSTSKRILEEHLEEPIDAVAFPYGRPRRHVSQRTLELANELGFQIGVTVLYRGVRPDDQPLGIPRFAVSDDSVDMVRAKIFGSFDIMGLWQERAPLWAVRVVAGKHFLA